MYMVFIFCAFSFGGIYQDTPDQLVSTFFYLSAGLLLSIRLHQSRVIDHVLLGLATGVGYYAKTVFFPLGLCFCAVSLFLASKERRWIALSTPLIFLMIVFPLVCQLSFKFHHPTIGEIGKITYAECYTFRYPLFYAQGKELKHPVRRLNASPDIFEFSQPIGGTLPIWYERFYWMEGCNLIPNFMDIFKCSIFNTAAYLLAFGGALLLSYVVCLISLKSNPITYNSVWQYFCIYIPAVFCFVLYFFSMNLCILWESRYYAAATVMLISAYLCSIRLPNSDKRRHTMKLMLLALVMPLVLHQCWQTINDFVVFDRCDSPIDWWIAKDLHDCGIKPNDHVAEIITDPLVSKIWYGPIPVFLVITPYWAHLAELRIVADIPTNHQFWKLTANIQTMILQKLRPYGVKAVILAGGVHPQTSDKHWRKLSRSGYYSYFFD